MATAMTPGRVLRLSRDRWWQLYLAAGAAAIFMYLLLSYGAPQVFGSQVLLVVVYSLLSLSAAVAVGAAARRSVHPLPWALLAVGQLAYWVGDTLFYVRHTLLGATAFPSVADLLYAAHYAPVLVALFLLIRSRSADKDISAVLDAAMVTLGAGVLVWTLLVRPGLGDSPGASGVLALIYQPVLDLAVLALALRLTMGAGTRPPVFWFLIAWMGTTLATNTVFGIQQAHHAYCPGLLDAGWLVAYLCLGAAALHPSRDTLALPTGPRTNLACWARMLPLTGACLTGPALLVAGQRHSQAEVRFLAGASALMSLLVLTRLAGLIAEARAAAVTDPLTGLGNRALFLQQLQTALAHSRRIGSTVAVLFVDLDRFQYVNDSLGHNAGDRLLQQVATQLAGRLRAGDVVARHGGDEFTVLVQDLPHHHGAWAVADRLRATLSQSFSVEGQRVDCSVSIGVAVDLDGTDDATDLLRHADEALHRAKETGRNRVEVFDPTTKDAVRRRLGEQSELRHALDHGQIEGWIQPIVSLATGQIVGGEALARWRHPERGILPPGQFLPTAAQCGLLTRLSTHIAEQTCLLRRELAPWVAPGFQLAFNIGDHEHGLPHALDHILSAADRHGVNGEGLTIEVTETALITDPSAAATALRRARHLGYTIALDDFGTGHSSLALVRDLPLDTLKIDRSFVSRMGRSPTDAAIVIGVLDLARRLDLRVVAEGVETSHERDQLIRYGAEDAQGYHYAPAVTPATFQHWLHHGAPWQQEKHDTPR